MLKNNLKPYLQQCTYKRKKEKQLDTRLIVRSLKQLYYDIEILHHVLSVEVIDHLLVRR